MGYLKIKSLEVMVFYADDYTPVPCKCGISHEHGDGNDEFFDMPMVTDESPWQVPPRRTARCKHCKEVLVKERKLKGKEFI